MGTGHSTHISSPHKNPKTLLMPVQQTPKPRNRLRQHSVPCQTVMCPLPDTRPHLRHSPSCLNVSDTAVPIEGQLHPAREPNSCLEEREIHRPHPQPASGVGLAAAALTGGGTVAPTTSCAGMERLPLSVWGPTAASVCMHEGNTLGVPSIRFQKLRCPQQQSAYGS